MSLAIVPVAPPLSGGQRGNYGRQQRTAPADPAAAPAKKKSSKGKFILMLGILVLLLGGGGAAAFFAFRKPAAGATGDAAPKKATKPPTGIISFEPFVVNLADPGAQHFLRISVRLIVADEEEAKKIEESQVQLMRLRSGIVDLLTSRLPNTSSRRTARTRSKKKSPNGPRRSSSPSR